MNMVAAVGATLGFAYANGYYDISFDEAGVDFNHLKSMKDRIDENPKGFSEGKLGRWLGYMQGVLVANQCATLEQMKELNKRFADEKEVWFHPKCGKTYEIVGEVRLQCSTKQLSDGDMLVLYRSLEDGSYSARDPDEFHDGRFVQI